jgi:uncharacterized protein
MEIEHPVALSNARLLVWDVGATAGFDAAWVEVEQGRLLAEGELVAQQPVAHSARYALETDGDYTTRRLTVQVRSPGGSASLDLRREDGRWTVNGSDRPDLASALDCDLAGCPLTNTMPILRHDLHRRADDLTFTMAFVRLPDLAVVPSEQRYTHLRPEADGGAIVRYRSGAFQSDLVIDGDGFVVEYPKLGARRVEAQSS